MRRFHEKALDCCDLVDEQVLVKICLHDMAEEYIIFLENLSFPSFSKLIKEACRIKEAVNKPMWLPGPATLLHL